MTILNVMDVADFLIATANEGYPEEDDGMTNIKFNKFLFLAQAASLQRFSKLLFNTPLEAWKYGSVVKVIPVESIQKKSKTSLCLSTCNPNPMRTPSLPSLTRKGVHI
nr:hypothetical protein [Bifidobacterium catenulatum]